MEKIKIGDSPEIRGTGVRVGDVLKHLSSGDSIEEVITAYTYRKGAKKIPLINEEDVLNCLEFSANLIEKIYGNP